MDGAVVDTDGDSLPAKKAKLETTGPSTPLTLTLADGATVVATAKLLGMSRTLANCVGDSDSAGGSAGGPDSAVVPTTAAVLADVEAFCARGTLKDAADLRFETLLPLIKAANFLDIAPMLEAAYSQAAAMIKAATTRSIPEALFDDATAAREPGAPGTIEEAAQFLRALASYEPSMLAAVKAATIPESETVAGKHPLVAWKILKDKSAERIAAEAARLTADIAAAGIKTVTNGLGNLSVGGVEEKDIDAATEVLAYTDKLWRTNEFYGRILFGREIACRIKAIKEMSGNGTIKEMTGWGHDDNYGNTRSSRSAFNGSVAVDGEIFLVGSKSAPLVFSMSVEIGAVLIPDDGNYHYGQLEDDTDSISLVVKDPDNVECSIFNGEFDSEEEIAAIQQDPARVFGPDSITDKEIRLLTLKEYPRDCRTDQDYGMSWDGYLEGPLLRLLVDACRKCAHSHAPVPSVLPPPDDAGNYAWEKWGGITY